LQKHEAPSSAQHPVDSGKGRAFAALRHPPFRVYFACSFLAQAGDNMEHIITYWAMYQAFHSPALAGYAVISHWLPVLLFGLYAGALADRFDCRRLIQLATAVGTSAQVSWGILLVTDSLEEWHAVVLLTMHGIAALFHGPATQLVMHDMVGRQDLQSAVRLSATGRQVGTLLGPGVGSALMLVVGPGVGLFINALTQLPLAVWLIFAPYTGHLRDAEGRERRSMSLQDVVGTVRQLTLNPAITAMLAVMGLSAVLVGNAFQAQMPEFAEDLGDSDGGHGYTALQMAGAAGALLAAFTLETAGVRLSVPFGILAATLFAVTVLGFAAAPSIQVAVVLLFLAGAFRLAFSTTAQAIVQLAAPAAIRGRALGLFSTAQMGLQVGSGFTVGVLGALIGVHLSLGLSAVVLALGALAMLAWVKSKDALSTNLAAS